jgi:hypothetical protein
LITFKQSQYWRRDESNLEFVARKSLLADHEGEAAMRNDDISICSFY